MKLYKSGETPRIGDRVKFTPYKQVSDALGIALSISDNSLGIVSKLASEVSVKVKWDNYPDDGWVEYVGDLSLIRRTNVKAFL